MQNPFVKNEIDYCDIIAEIGSANKNSLIWWACEASSKNFGNSDLWKSFHQWPEEFEEKKDAPSILSLFSFAAYFMTSAFFAIPLRLKAKNFFTKYSKGRILFFSHFNDSLWEDKNYRDPYFQPLMDFLNDNGHKYDSIAFSHGNPKETRKHCLEKFTSKNRVFPIELFSSPLIIIKSLLISLICKPKLNKAHFFRGKNISPLILKQCEHDRKNGNIFHNLCIYFSLKKALKKLKPERIIWPWENHCWEKLMLRAKVKVSPETIAIGYQHSTISMYLLNHFPGKDECNSAPFPDKILTTGEETYKILKSFGCFPDKTLQISCALRYENLHKKISQELPPKKTYIGIALTTYAESDKKVIECAKEAFKNDDVRVILKPHPMKCKHSYLESIKAAIPDNFDFFKGPISEFLSKICILLYSETSVCFEALAEKVPCIYIDTGKGTLGDTMLNNESMKWSVKTPSELIETRNEIMSINLDALKKAGEEAGKYLNKYFHPVTEENLKKFIET